MDKKKTKKNQKNFSSEKKKSSTQIIFHDQEKKELSINHFNSIFSHKKTILCFTLAITIHYFIFSIVDYIFSHTVINTISYL